nr:MAG TPA: hypothetical protein [Caudoviricetes sp.]
MIIGLIHSVYLVSPQRSKNLRKRFFGIYFTYQRRKALKLIFRRVFT